MGTDVERFLGASASLANRNNLPTRKGRRQEQFSTSHISRVEFGQMLAQVAVVPMDVDRITLIGYDGDEEMLRAVRGYVEGSTLKLEGQIPFLPGGGSGRGSHMVFGDVVGGVTIMGGSVYAGGSIGGDVIMSHGRVVDLDRAIQFALVVPTTMNIKVSDLIGAIGITDHLDATLDFSPSIRAELSASSVNALIGDIHGSGKVTLDSVSDNADLEVSGSGSFHVGSVGGEIQAKVSGSGDVTINGGNSRRLRATVSGSGNVNHHGVVTGGARLRVSGSGHVNAVRVDGDVDAKVSGSGSIYANGRSYEPRC